MDPKRLKKLVKQLRTLGISYYRDKDVELRMDNKVIALKGKTDNKAIASQSEPARESENIPHVVQDLKSVMALDDNALVDRLFPEQSSGEQA